MVKTLIVENDFQYSKNIINNVISKIDDIKLDYIATNEDEVINFVSENSIDLIIVDLEMTKINVIEILEQLKNLDIIKIPQIVITSSETTKNTCKKIKRIVDDINSKINCFNIRDKVIRELIQKGYNLKYKGTIYMIDVIMYIYRY